MLVLSAACRVVSDEDMQSNSCHSKMYMVITHLDYTAPSFEFQRFSLIKAEGEKTQNSDSHHTHS